MCAARTNVPCAVCGAHPCGAESPDDSAFSAIIRSARALLGPRLVTTADPAACLNPSADAGPAGDRAAGLSPSELAVVELVMRGLSNRDIAIARGVSVQTTANQLTAAYKKLGVQSRRELRARWVASPRAPTCLDGVLTPREREVLRLMQQGHANKVIAPTVGVAISTVSTLLTRLRRKLSTAPLGNSAKAPIAGGLET